MEYWIFSWELAKCVGAVVETRERPLMGLLSGAGSYYPSRAHDSATVTVVSGDFMRDSYPYADVLVPTSGLRINFFPGIGTWGFCQFPCCLRRLCWFSHQPLYFFLPQMPRVVMSMASIFDTRAHVSFISLSTYHRDRVWQRMQCSVLYWVDWTRFLNKNSRPRDHFFFSKIII